MILAGDTTKSTSLTTTLMQNTCSNKFEGGGKITHMSLKFDPLGTRSSRDTRGSGTVTGLRINLWKAVQHVIRSHQLIRCN